MMTNASSIAIIVPKIGGGTERHAREMVDSWNKQGMEVVFLEVSGRIIKATIINDSIKSFSFLLIGNEDNLLDLINKVVSKFICEIATIEKDISKTKVLE